MSTKNIDIIYLLTYSNVYEMDVHSRSKGLRMDLERRVSLPHFARMLLVLAIALLLWVALIIMGFYVWGLFNSAVHGTYLSKLSAHLACENFDNYTDHGPVYGIPKDASDYSTVEVLCYEQTKFIGN